jgi:glycosyltransferase involved in cell wall biosynthesis
MPKVSIIIPYYNREEWLSQAIASVLNQTVTDIEVIIIDDGSDKNPYFLRTISDSRLRYIRQENKGPASARNLGIDNSKGEYIAFLDSDDLFLPNKLEVQLQHMENDSEIAWSHTSYTRIDPDGNFLEAIQSGEFSGNVYPQIISYCPIATPTVMIRKELLRGMRFPESMRIAEDVLFWIDIAMRYKLMGIDEPLTKVRMHGNNASINADVQLLGYKILLDHDYPFPDIRSFFYILHAKSKLYNQVGRLTENTCTQLETISSYMKSIGYNPLNFSSYYRLAHSMVPPRWRPLRKTILNLILKRKPKVCL